MIFSSYDLPSDQKEILEAFDQCTDFSVFSLKEKMMMLHLIEIRQYSAGSELCLIRGAVEESFFIVSCGKFYTRWKNNGYKECVIGDLFGEIGVLSNIPRLDTVRALETSKLLVFNREIFFNPEILPTGLILKLVTALTRKIIRHYDQA